MKPYQVVHKPFMQPFWERFVQGGMWMVIQNTYMKKQNQSFSKYWIKLHILLIYIIHMWNIIFRHTIPLNIVNNDIWLYRKKHDTSTWEARA